MIEYSIWPKTWIFKSSNNRSSEYLDIPSRHDNEIKTYAEIKKFAVMLKLQAVAP